SGRGQTDRAGRRRTRRDRLVPTTGDRAQRYEPCAADNDDHDDHHHDGHRHRHPSSTHSDRPTGRAFVLTRHEPTHVSNGDGTLTSKPLYILLRDGDPRVAGRPEASPCAVASERGFCGPG